MLELPQKTVSLWSYVNRFEILEKLLNPLYVPCNKIVWPSVAPMSMVIASLILIYSQIPLQFINEFIFIILDLMARSISKMVHRLEQRERNME